MKHVRIQLEDDLHRHVRTAAVARGMTLQQALAEGALLFVSNYNPRPLTPSEYAKGEELSKERRDAQAERTAAWDKACERHVDPIIATCATCRHATPYGDPYEEWNECLAFNEQPAKFLPICEEVGAAHLLVRPDFSCSQWRALDGATSTERGNGE